jgi:hypothetical protein
MVSSHMASFAQKFEKFVWQTMPNQLLGGKGFMYQAYVRASFTATSEAMITLKHKPAWEVQVKRCARIGRLDLQWATALELFTYKCMKIPKKDKKEDYSTGAHIADSSRTWQQKR